MPIIKKFTDRKTLDNLEYLYKNCSTNSWDGYNSLPITQDVYIKAFDFIISLLSCTGCVPDEVSVDTDGEISFEWIKEPLNRLSISVGKDRITYAGVFGDKEVHGDMPYTKKVSKDLLNTINLIYL